ncbi:unnamed protein product [Brachionus calyciflorus]|uniref:IST1 homolog n=1 Tax=Brachionus calyciflorus TaxID=104777 RepID=A0A813T1Z1_9BILA|nr:unnamed protein product [Brachionus calyciflorus]
MSNYTKLKTNLKLAIQRLKLLEKKKTELSLKSRKEIADYIQVNKPDRARIRVEHIIREDNYVEAMEMLEMFCDLLLARFGLIEKMKELDPGLDEAIATLIWASPRVSNDIQEFKLIGDAFAQKYGKKYAEACKADTLNNVNEKVKKRLGLEPPSKLLIEQYLIEIAKNFNIPYEPDQTVMLRSGIYDQELIDLTNKTNEITSRYGGNNGGNNNSGGNGGGFSAGFEGASGYEPEKQPIGFDSPKNHGNDDLIDLNNNYDFNKNPPELPKSLPFGDISTITSQPYPPPSYDNKNNNVILRNNGNFNNAPVYGAGYGDLSGFAPEKSAPPADELFGEQAPPLPNKTPVRYSRPPSYGPPSSNFNTPPPPFNLQNTNKYDFDDLGLPSVPNSHPDNETTNDFDELDDLTKRFQNLKNNK